MKKAIRGVPDAGVAGLFPPLSARNANLIKRKERGNMARLTYEEALKETIKMWVWLKSNPNTDKSGYFKKHGIVHIPLNECYLCESCYTYEEDVCLDDCIDNCPVAWPVAQAGRETGFLPCCEDKSPYMLWLNAIFFRNTEKQKIYAEEIIKLCINALRPYRNVSN